MCVERPQLHRQWLSFLWIITISFCSVGHSERPARNHLSVAAADALATANEVTLYSLSPDWVWPPRGKQHFYSYEILGSVTLSNPADLTSLGNVIRDGVASYDDEEYTCCFKPRHGLRIRKANHCFDFVVCFECKKLIVYVDGKESEPILGVTGTSNVLNEILKANKVPLPPQPAATEKKPSP
jgi:hypothetical protein